MRYSDWVLHIFVEEIQCTSITNPIDASINMSCFYDDIFMPQKKNLGACFLKVELKINIHENAKSSTS